jgi:hypothetical protein
MLRTAQRIFAWLQLQSWKYAGYCLEWKRFNNTLIKDDSPIRIEGHPSSPSEIGPFFVLYLEAARFTYIATRQLLILSEHVHILCVEAANRSVKDIRLSIREHRGREGD